ncbi:MAG: BLUF domain-containing protein, partial [Rhodospirillaceae bacterium]|nr:BLUF domain-containing protein [Rhodospirillaceae bacterium]
MSLHQLIYSSSPSKKVLKSHLYIILRQARKNNKIIGVTGLLIYSDEHFFQILEGEKEVVSELF